jgi:hypothetical protein
MSVDVIPGGQRRIDRVLDPGFIAEARSLELSELRARRDEAEAEEADISYLRRLLQGRLDILRAELVRRSQGGDRDVAGLRAALPSILSNEMLGGEASGRHNALPRIQGPSHGAARHRRRVERLVSDETLARLPELDVDELTEVVETLAREEEAVSAGRRAVQRVVDVLHAELARRYREGTAKVSQLLE